MSFDIKPLPQLCRQRFDCSYVWLSKFELGGDGIENGGVNQRGHATLSAFGREGCLSELLAEVARRRGGFQRELC